MTKYKWSKDLRIGIKELDDQHKHMIDLVNSFSSLGIKSVSRNDLLDVFNDIISYAHVHFISEENFLKKISYPEAEKHIKEHQKILKKINDIFLNFSDENINHTVKEVEEFLTSWIEEHLMEEDKKFANYYLAKKVKTNIK